MVLWFFDRVVVLVIVSWFMSLVREYDKAVSIVSVFSRFVGGYLIVFSLSSRIVEVIK